MFFCITQKNEYKMDCETLKLSKFSQKINGFRVNFGTQDMVKYGFLEHNVSVTYYAFLNKMGTK